MSPRCECGCLTGCIAWAHEGLRCDVVGRYFVAPRLIVIRAVLNRCGVGNPTLGVCPGWPGRVTGDDYEVIALLYNLDGLVKVIAAVSTVYGAQPPGYFIGHLSAYAFHLFGTVKSL